jgi:phosphoribosyl-ATP pyrophosphohydrolase
MSDSLERLYMAVVAAKDLDPATSRTARLFQRGPAKMAKKLAEEAIEVVIDAVNGNADAVVRESADLLYNLSVLWVAAGVCPRDVWDEMDRRERSQGIAEKLPKGSPNKARMASPVKSNAKLAKPAESHSPPRRRFVALTGSRLKKRR